MPAFKLIFLAACLFMGGMQVISQDYPFIKYTPKDGLISNRVQNFYQDTKGRIFFMTYNGLSIYDGVRYLNYSVEEGLSNPVVNDLLEITPDSLLIAPNINELNVLVNGSVKKLKTRDGFCPVINKFFRDNKNIYVASDQGLYRFDEDIFIPVFVDDKDPNTVESIYDIVDLNNYLLLHRSHFPHKFSNLLLVNKKTLAAQPFPIVGVISSILPLKEENLLLLIADQKLMSIDLDAAEKGIVKFRILPERFNYITRLVPIKILSDTDQNIWCVTNNAIIKIKKDGSHQAYDKSNGLNANNIRSIAVDKENVLWILTDGSGVFKLVNTNVEVHHHDIKDVYEDVSSGETWILKSSGKVLSCLNDGKTRDWTINFSTGFSGLGMRNNSMVLFNYNSIYEGNPKKNSEGLSPLKIYDAGTDDIDFPRAVIDYNDNIYIPGKFLRVIKSNNKILKIETPYYIDQVSIDSNNQLWAITRVGELLCYKINIKDSNLLTLVSTTRLNIKEPRSIVVDRNGKIWIGTRFSGLYCLEFNKRIVSTSHWSTADGLSDNFIYFLACDNKNVIWVGTQGGLDKITDYGEVAEGVTRSNNIYQVISKINIGRDNVWATGGGNIIKVLRQGDNLNNYQPGIQIIRIHTGNKNLGILSDGVKLKAKTKELTIDVAAPSFIDEKRIRFSYMLDGDEKTEWSIPAADASFRFINLQPGNYTLRVKAIFPVAGYKTQELSYHFAILPEWWQTWWFRMLILLSLITALVLILKTYYHNKLQRQKIIFEKQQAIQQERTRIAMEMHDDLGSGLTAIRYLASGLVSNPMPVIKHKALKIESSAQQLVDSMNDIIWTIKSDNNTLSDVLSYIRKQTADMLDNIGIDYHFEFPKNASDVNLNNDQKRNLLLISKEIVHNVIKHSGATIVSITGKQNQKYFHLKFSDNGKGVRNIDHDYCGNGMKNIQKRAQQLGGHVEIINNGGMTVIITVKLF